MRTLMGFAASALAGLAAVVASLDGDTDIVPFFVGLTFLGGVEAWAAHPPFVGPRRRVARGAALVWALAAVWVGVLLIWYVSMEGSGPPPRAEDTYLGLTASVYHLVGLYGGGVFIVVSAFAREGFTNWWCIGSRSDPDGSDLDRLRHGLTQDRQETP